MVLDAILATPVLHELPDDLRTVLGPGDWCWPSVKGIGAYTGNSIGTCVRAIRWLADNGNVRVRKVYWNGCNRSFLSAVSRSLTPNKTQLIENI